MTLVLVDEAGRPLTATWGIGRVVARWPRVVRVWVEGSLTGALFERPTNSDREWIEPPWATREASAWAFSGRRLWC